MQTCSLKSWKTPFITCWAWDGKHRLATVTTLCLYRQCYVALDRIQWIVFTNSLMEWSNLRHSLRRTCWWIIRRSLIASPPFTRTLLQMSVDNSGAPSVMIPLTLLRGSFRSSTAEQTQTKSIRSTCLAFTAFEVKQLVSSVHVLINRSPKYSQMSGHVIVAGLKRKDKWKSPPPWLFFNISWYSGQLSVPQCSESGNH